MLVFLFLFVKGMASWNSNRLRCWLVSKPARFTQVGTGEALANSSTLQTTKQWCPHLVLFFYTLLLLACFFGVQRYH